MSDGKHIIICQSGGKFTTTNDGSMSYTGGDAYAIGVNNKTRFDELKSEMADIWKYDPCSITIKYFLPNNTKKLITISGDRDIQRMLDFYEYSTNIDVYVFTGEDNIISDASSIPDNRSSQTTMVEPVTPVDHVSPSDLMVSSDPESMMAVESQPAILMDAGEGIQFKLVKSSEHCITGVDQLFNSVHDFRDALRKYCVACGFACTKTHDDSRRVSAKCKVVLGEYGHQDCLPQSIMKDMIQDSPTSKPEEIADEMQQDVGIELKHSQTCNGMETARKELQGSFKDSYNHLPWLCEKIAETNPGSVATLTTRKDMSFRRLFVAFYASRPLLFLDTMSLKSIYNAELLTAAALDGNDGVFPVAFAIVDRVNDDNWNWFFEQMNTTLAVSQPITFVSDRNIGLRRTISNIFGNSFHAYCLHHLTEDLKKDLRGHHNREVIRLILAYFFDAAYTPAPDSYRKCVESIRNISLKAYEWIMQSEPRYWTNALFEGSRYNNLTCNIAESFYSWVTDLPMLPITDLIESMSRMSRKMMELIRTRRLDSDQWSARITTTIGNKLKEEIAKARSFKVIGSSGCNFEVSDDGLAAIYVVNIDHCACSCGMWQVTGIPCLHAVAAVEHNSRNLCDYCSKYFTTETFRLLYLESINPLPTADMPVHTDSSPLHIHPPVLHWSPGLPNTRRIRSKRVVKRPLRCSGCKGVGHNGAFCPIIIPS